MGRREWGKQIHRKQPEERERERGIQSKVRGKEEKMRKEKEEERLPRDGEMNGSK